MDWEGEDDHDDVYMSEYRESAALEIQEQNYIASLKKKQHSAGSSSGQKHNTVSACTPKPAASGRVPHRDGRRYDGRGVPSSNRPMQHRAKPKSSYNHDKDNRCTLFVSNIPLKFWEFDLEELFEPYGKIFKTSIQRTVDPEASSKYGFVVFEREHEAERAMKALQNTHLQGRQLRVVKSTSTKTKQEIEREENEKKVNKQRQETQRQHLQEEDDHKLWYLIETYTFLLAQPSSESSALPDLGDFLGVVNNQTNSLVPNYEETEHGVSMDVKTLEQSFIQSLAEEFENNTLDDKAFESHDEDVPREYV